MSAERTRNITAAVAAEVLDGARGVLDRDARAILVGQSDDDRAALLFRLLKPFIGGAFGNAALAKIDDVVQRYAEFLARHGIAFPQLKAVIFEKRGHLDLVRADLDHAGIQQLVRNAIVRFPDIAALELIAAICGAFPDYRGGAVGNQLHYEKTKPKLAS